MNLATTNNLEASREGMLGYLSTSLDILTSMGTAVQDGTQASALALGELTLAHRDSFIRKLPSVSSQLRENPRTSSLVEDVEPTVSDGNEPSLFGSVIAKLGLDREAEASSSSPTRSQVRGRLPRGLPP